MKYYEYDCPKCNTHIISPQTEEDHINECDGKFKGTLLRNL